MSNLWKEIKDNVKEWSAAAIKKADEVSKLAVEKTGDFTKISKIKLDIHQTQKDIDKNFEDLGRYIYMQVKDKNVTSFKTNTEFNEAIKKLDDFKTKIKNFEKEIDNIKKEVEKAEVVEKPKQTVTPKKTQAKKTTKTAKKPPLKK
jgi:uncharacterized protein Yka (UPF0111/DUF47 family)